MLAAAYADEFVTDAAILTSIFVLTAFFFCRWSPYRDDWPEWTR